MSPLPPFSDDEYRCHIADSDIETTQQTTGQWRSIDRVDGNDEQTNDEEDDNEQTNDKEDNGDNAQYCHHPESVRAPVS
jgi:hypothetical protein